MYLVDTNVLSAGAPTKAAPAHDLIAWMDRHSAHLRLSVVTIAEIEDGIAKSRRAGATRKADRLSAWLETLIHLYAAQILPVDLAIARRIGRLSDRARERGHAPGWPISPSPPPPSITVGRSSPATCAISRRWTCRRTIRSTAFPPGPDPRGPHSREQTGNCSAGIGTRATSAKT